MFDFLFGKPIEEIVTETLNSWRPRKPGKKLKREEDYYRDLFLEKLKKELGTKARVYKEKRYTDSGDTDISIETKDGTPIIIMEFKLKKFQSAEKDRLVGQVINYNKVKGLEYLYIVFVGEEHKGKNYFNEFEDFINGENQKELNLGLDIFNEDRIRIFKK